MGFNLGKALGKVAGFAVSKVTGGLVKPRIDFNPPTRRPGTAVTPYILPTVPGIAGGGYVAADSVFVNRGPFGITQSVKVYGPRAAAGFAPAGNGSALQPWGGGTPQQGGGGMVQYQVPSCPMPVGRGRVAIMPSPCSGYHWNRGRYYVFGDCRTGSQAGIVEPGQRLVRNRRINPANAQAARHAARRLSGTVKLLRTIERVTAKLVGRAGGSGGRRSKACGPKCGRKGCTCAS